MSYFHSVTLDREKCHGCTNCIKGCPTEAIRVRGGKAKIIKERCIDCGECIRICPYHAKLAVTDSFEQLENYRYNIAMPAPSFYGQFKKIDNRNKVLTAFTKIGFDDVFEVSIGAEYAMAATRQLLEEGALKKPVISSACPAVVRLIRARFPDLLENISGVLSPMEIAAFMARENAKKKTGFSDEEIGVFFITPCPAKITSIKKPLTLEKSNVNGAFSVSEVYLKIRAAMKGLDEIKTFPCSSTKGLAWARSGGESMGTRLLKHITVDGIKNVISILEAIEDEKIDDIDFAELSACPGGCVGGPLNVANSFIASTRIKNMETNDEEEYIAEEYELEKLLKKKTIEKESIMSLDDDFGKAMEMMEKIENIYSEMPKLDCGSCGAPSCKALAEDIVRGFGNENDCIFKMRERIKELAKELFDLESQPYGNNSDDEL